jgi:hypothetical protein
LDRGYGKAIQQIEAEVGVRPQIVMLPATLSADEFEQRYSSSSMIELGTS